MRDFSSSHSLGICCFLLFQAAEQVLHRVAQQGLRRSLSSHPCRVQRPPPDDQEVLTVTQVLFFTS